MGLITEVRARARHIVGPVLGICAVAYFAYHAIHGDRGLIAWWNLNQKMETARSVLADIVRRRKVLENRVRRLSPGTLDPDLLEERARLMLDYGYSDETVIITDDPPGP